MKQKRSRDSFEKAENASVRNTLAQRENTLCLKASPENGLKEKKERLTGGPTRQVQIQQSSPAPEGCGGRRC